MKTLGQIVSCLHKLLGLITVKKQLIVIENLWDKELSFSTISSFYTWNNVCLVGVNFDLVQIVFFLAFVSCRWKLGVGTDAFPTRKQTRPPRIWFSYGARQIHARFALHLNKLRVNCG